jgi:uncharacterized protein YecE (DUF72 family)
VAGAEIIVGTSGYQYKDWVGPFYPEGTKPDGMLSEYAKRFAAVEINFTYYGMPRAKQMEGMADRTPEGFEFVVKAHKTTTHEGSLDDIPAFMDAMRPLEERGRFSGVLCQFPWGFKNTRDSRAHLAAVGKGFGETPVFVEFRHASWITEPIFKFLESAGLLYVSVDEPELEGLVPRIGRLTGDVGYLRFHSRRESTWWGSGGKLRYDYDYSPEELAEWLPTLEEFAQSARKVFVFFNNCHRGQAAANAESFRKVLEEHGLAG